jgi:hypothetical protein
VAIATILLVLRFAMTTAAFLIADKGLDDALPLITFAQSSGNVTSPLNKTQEWISEKDHVKILFTYQPERPIIDTFTKLEFNVINLTSNENLKDFVRSSFSIFQCFCSASSPTKYPKSISYFTCKRTG